MSDQLENLASEIEAAKALPIEEQPAAFETIRRKLEDMIADSRPQETE